MERRPRSGLGLSAQVDRVRERAVVLLQRLDLQRRALEHGDEHVIKFTEAALREHALRPDPRFPAAIVAAHDRIPSPDK